MFFAGDLAFKGGHPFVLEGSLAGFRSAVRQMRDLEPDVLLPGHGPVCRGDEVGRVLDDLDGYVDWVEDVARESYAAGLTPLEAAQKHRDNPYADWPETERFVCNLHRAYAELDRLRAAGPSTLPRVWPDMVAFHGGPIACHA